MLESESFDLGLVFANVMPLLAYLGEEGVSKGDRISRTLQVVGLVERDNALLDGAMQEDVVEAGLSFA